MARWRAPEGLDPPKRLVAYDPAVWGPGDAGIRAWKDAALAWLAEDPARSLPVGENGDVLAVINEAVRLLMTEHFGGDIREETGGGEA